MIREAWIVFDPGFGDAGKGATVDFLVRERGAGLVVRYHGGAQAGHNVVTPGGRHHTFSQFGAGSFVGGVETLLGPDFVLHPGGLLAEERHLRCVGVRDPLSRLRVDGRALVSTPYHQAAGRLRELLRGERAHGTCGLGIGEAVADVVAGADDALRAAELSDPPTVRAKLASQRARKRAQLAAARGLHGRRARREWELLRDLGTGRVLEQWRPLLGRLRVVDAPGTAATIRASRSVVFEGAQGVLLDQAVGFHPHTTWSDCTPRGALALVEGTGARVVRLAVLRPYAIRHGRGPLPTWDPGWDARLPEPHNDDAGWQGPVRRGPLDLVLLRYGLEAAGGADALALTCRDRLAGEVPVCVGYRGPAGGPASGGERRTLSQLDPEDLEARARRTRRLGRARPRLERVTSGELGGLLRRELGVPVRLEATGPTWRDRRMDAAAID